MKPQVPTPRPFTNWPDALVDAGRFRDEQAKLAKIWTFLGFKHRLAKDGDWFRTTIATRSVFVQRFGDELRGFENRCAHRSFPLRNADAGNGPIRCDFHHWRYDKNGELADVPCPSLFAGLPGDLAVRLVPLEIDTCGSLIFGRFAPLGSNQTLRQYLGESFDILAAISDTPAAPKVLTRTVAANWRLCFHANLDEYHAPVIHPGTLGKSGYPNPDRVNHFRFGWHSAFFDNVESYGFAKMAAECRAGTWQSTDYRVFHIFPDLTVSHLCAQWENWFIVIVQYAPVSPGRSIMRVWYYPAPFGTPRPPWYDLLTRPVTNLARKFIMSPMIARVLNQDNAMCERQQSIAHQLSPAPILGALEGRLAWYEEAYAEAMRAA